VKLWVCAKVPGGPRGGPGYAPCPSCREVTPAEHAAMVAAEFSQTWVALGFGRRPVEDAVEAVLADLFERGVIE
jgi:hypothetical protein